MPQLPQNYNRVVVVNSISSAFAGQFGPANCFLFPRTLRHDFNELSRRLEKTDVNRALKRDYLAAIVKDMKENQAAALAAIIDDMIAVENEMKDTDVRLRVQKKYTPGLYEFHADGGERVICCYNDPATEWLRNEDALEGLHPYSNYKRKPGALVYCFNAGDIWRHSGLQEDKIVPPFIHRAPQTGKRDPARLLLVTG